MAKYGLETIQLDLGSQGCTSFTPSYSNFSAKIYEITVANVRVIQDVGMHKWMLIGNIDNTLQDGKPDKLMKEWRDQKTRD